MTCIKPEVRLLVTIYNISQSCFCDVRSLGLSDNDLLKGLKVHVGTSGIGRAFVFQQDYDKFQLTCMRVLW